MREKKINWVNRAFGYLAVMTTVAQAWIYTYVPTDLFNLQVCLFAILGVGLFCVLMLFKKTAVLAPISLMCCDFLCVCAFAKAEGLIDYLSTAFFSGFSFEAFFNLDTFVWVTVLLFVLSFIFSSIAMYIPPFRKSKEEKNHMTKKTELSTGGNAK